VLGEARNSISMWPPWDSWSLAVTRGCGDVDVVGIGKDDANVWGGVAIVWQGASVRASGQVSTGWPTGTPHSPLAEGAQHRRGSLVKKWLSHGWPPFPFNPLRGVGLAFFEQHISHQRLVCRHWPCCAGRACPFQSGIGPNRRNC